MIAPIQFYLTGTISSIVFIFLIKTVLPIKSFQFSILCIILNDKLKKDMIAQNLKNLETITNPSKSVTWYPIMFLFHIGQEPTNLIRE